MHLLFLFAALSCPSLDSSTVEGAYGAMQLTVDRSEKEYRCSFAGARYELTLHVLPLAPDQFGRFVSDTCRGSADKTQLKAIGNEAVACDGKIVSRVRDRVFILSLSTTDKALDSKTILAKNTALAEHVAGNLF